MPNNNPQQTSQSQQQKSADNPGKLADRIEKGAEQTTNSAIQRVREAREQAASGLEHQRAEIAQRIRRLGGVMRSGSETLSTDDPYAQHLLSSTGDRVEQVADYVENLTPSQLAEDVQTFARQRPAVFFGGAFLLGLGLGRFVKSSAGAVSGSGGGRQRAYDRSNEIDEAEDSYAESDVGQSLAGDASVSQRRRTTANPGGSGVSYGSGGTSSSTLPYGVGSSNSATVTTAPSYGQSGGAQSATPSSSTPGAASSTNPNSATSGSTARETERGQGSKS